MLVSLFRRVLPRRRTPRIARNLPALEPLETRLVPAPIYNRLPPVLVNPGNPSQGTDGNGEEFYAPPELSVAENAAGDFVVVWTTDDSQEGLDILAQRFGPTGNPLGGVIDVTNQIFPSSGFEHPSVGMDSAGDFVIAWDNDGAVFATRYDANGNALDSSPLEVDCNGYTPAVAVADNGEFLVTYAAEEEGGNSILARRGFLTGPDALDPNGSFTVASVPYCTDETLASPAVATDAAGDFVVAYQETFDEFGAGSEVTGSIFAQQVDAAGNLVWGSITLSTSGNAAAPSVAENRSSGQFAVSWVESTTTPEMFVQTFNADGTPLAGPFAVSSTANPPEAQGYDTPGIAADSNGDFVATWAVHAVSNVTDPEVSLVPNGGGKPAADPDPTGTIFAQLFDANGNLTGSPIAITTQPSAPGPVGVAMNPAGDFVVAYTSAEQTTPTQSGPSATGNLYDEIAVVFQVAPPAPPPPVVVPPVVSPVAPPTIQTLSPALSIALSASTNDRKEQDSPPEEIPIVPPERLDSLEVMLRQAVPQSPRRDDPAATLIEQIGGSGGVGAISGKLFADLNGDGLFEVGKPPLAGRLIFLDLNNNGVLDPGEPTAITNDNGEYSFTNLPLQTYQVRQLVPGGDVQTLPPENRAYEVRLDNVRHDVGGRDFGNLNAPRRGSPLRLAPSGANTAPPLRSTSPQSQGNTGDSDSSSDDADD
jgi:hypothetical protein